MAQDPGTEREIDAVLTAGLRLMESRDLAGFRALHTPGATVWQNDGEGTRTIDARLEQITAFLDGVDSLRFEVVRRFHRPGEVLQQHVLHLVAPDGTDSRVHATVYFRFEGGLIAEIEEFLY
ncbi:nuclear transport factor 2 family protein [Kitasatospora sp. NPDC036755]|uniref:nuclear transport factor 2 family protein n=1 Tax=Kitasatospora sp. NPDC036755 TaxID=3154600 RepID=UPI0033E5E0AE